MTRTATLTPLRSLGPAGTHWRAAIGGRTRHDLEALDAVNTYRISKGHGDPATLSKVARLTLDATIHARGDIALRFRGQFVAYDRTRFQGFDPVSVV